MSTEKTADTMPIGIRFERRLRQRIKRQAKRNYRTFNREVLYLVSRGLEAMEREDAAQTEARP